jgi:hypothetical protein
LRHILSYKIFEGGNALDLVKPIKQSQVPQTIEALSDAVFPYIGLSGFGVDCMVLGTAGKKSSPDDESGDIDVGVDVSAYADRNGVSPEQVLKFIHDKLTRKFPMFQSRWLRGVDVVSFAYPIANDPGLGLVQVDFIPMKNMEWSKFIYHVDPASKYKSAHRNWLFAAIVSQIIEDESFDADGNMLGRSGYMMRLQDGLSRYTKSYEGKRGLLKNPRKIADSMVTDSPAELVRILFGDNIKTSDVATTEDVIGIINGPDFIWKDRLDAIKSEYARFLRKAGLKVPKEI